MTAVDRSRLPTPGPSRQFHFPGMTRTRLSNGLDVRVISHHSVPVAAVVLLVPGGSSVDPPGLPGLTSITADLLDEGSGGSSALEISDRIARIGADLDVEVGPDATIVSLITLERFLDTGLELVREMATAPTLADADFARVQQLRLERLRQMKDMPGALADRAFADVVYGAHPYAQPTTGTTSSLASIGVDEVRTYHARMFQPDGATLVIAGDRSSAELTMAAERAFGTWAPDPAAAPLDRNRAREAPPRVPTARLTGVARPGAAQSALRMGHVAASRSTPDYPALVLLNMVLGGQFVSRLNLNLREDKGFTYGVRTGFDLRRGEGPFVLETSVGTGATAAALAEAFREIREVRGDRPVTEDELAMARSAVSLGYPRGFETAQQMARSAAQLALHELPDSYFEDFVPMLDAVTLADVTAAAQRYLDPDRIATVIVGDIDAIGPSLAPLGLGEMLVVSPVI